MTYEDLWQRLCALYDTDEAKAIVRWVLDVRFGLSLTDIYCGKITQLSSDDQTELEKIMLRLEKAEPVQYVLEVADFYGRLFHIEHGVLIPRPETAELCQWVKEESPSEGIRLLDIGTGSGCIAVTLALELQEAKIAAWDISEKALRTAQENAKELGADVVFEKHDILHTQPSEFNDQCQWDAIVSNPPYICYKERTAMERNVLDYEPSKALFVPDEDPLLFYQAIARYASKTLKPYGVLYFELNPIYASDTVKMLLETGFQDTVIRQDFFGKDRFLKAMKI